ncbi:hypothetical protein KDW_38350 [Dictyobacter vulcani]|uniref:Uncharacterized protein n=1 Tax=Dictyobacter vulcani TaxID=2607529 RepID=A0A5J4KQ01_9CHLR|nr:hypothetical protein [Dictyobacter vulcani]GER89673.1 hypothetical protein KDW_38350 [Dictyobacter vulcani]
MYHALLRQPIYRSEAVTIVATLAQYIGLELSLEYIDIVVWEEYLILWIIRASSNTHEHISDSYHFVYARNQQHARDLSRKWLEHLPHLPHHSYTACPDGFMIGNIFIPGYIQKEECQVPLE